MKRVELIPESGKFYKVNMHSHTNISDGKLSPEEVKELYKSNGYSAVCYTDHEVLVGHKELCDDEFIALHGYEVAIKKNIHEKTALFMPVYHFNFIAKEQDNLVMPKYFKDNPSFPGKAKEWLEKCGQYEETIETVEYDQEWLNGYLSAVGNSGFLVNYNHPQWSLQNACDYINLKSLHSIEVINGGCNVLNDNTSLHYHSLLRAGNRIVPTGGDDNHAANECGQAWTMIKADELSYEALIQSYEKGYCYATEGPEILSLVLEGEKIKIKTSPASSIIMYSEGRYLGCVRSKIETYTEAEFWYSPEKMGRFFRIEVKDERGYKAFSNAFYIEDIEKMLEE